MPDKTSCASYHFRSPPMEPQKEKKKTTKKRNHNHEATKQEEVGSDQFEFCDVCKLNHDHGRRHKHLPSHLRALSAFLSRFRSKFSDLRFFLRNPSVLRPEHAALNRVWCIFCSIDLREISSTFACENAIKHLASEDHLKNLKQFLWKHGGSMDHVDSFRISETDLSKWEKGCMTLKSYITPSIEGPIGMLQMLSKDIQSENTSNAADSFPNSSFLSFNSSFCHGVIPLQNPTNEGRQVFHPEISQPRTDDRVPYFAGSSPMCSQGNASLWNGHASENALIKPIGSEATLHGQTQNGLVAWFQSNGSVQRFVSGENATHVSQMVTPIFLPSEGHQGNVYTGAPPPWLEMSEENERNLVNKDPLMDKFTIPVTQKGKSKKLNPKRVGAAWAERRKMELELERRGKIVPRDCDDNWLPNFGRVWQSGTRKESRKEFEMEKHKLFKENQCDTIFSVQPYISKRMRLGSSGKDGAANIHMGETSK